MSGQTNLEDRKARRQRRVEQAIVIAISLVVSLPFCNKAFHIDDPLYLHIAQQILTDPLHPFDGLINWQQVTEPAWQVSISPPGYSYWLAAWMAAGVTGEWGLHSASSFWLVVLGLSIYNWARRLGDWPLAATLLVISSPLVVAGQNLMLDVPMLALAASAIAVYQLASERDSSGLALVAGLLAGISVNVKYAGVVAIGVMAADTILWRRWRLLGAAIVGVLLLILGQLTLASKNGTPQLLFARQWISRLWPSDSRDILHRAAASLMYLGASAPWFLLLARALMRRSAWCLVVHFVSAAFAILVILDLRQREPLIGVASAAQAALFAWSGAVMLIWLVSQLARSINHGGWACRKDALLGPANTSRLRHGVMLVTWTAGFWYLGTLNGPFVAPRALLPCVLSLVLAVMAIAASLETLGKTIVRSSVAVALGCGLLVGASDYYWAGIYREYAPRFVQKYRPPSGVLYFVGHWGWQYYAERAGMTQFDPLSTRLQPGDTIIWPRNVDCPLPMSIMLRRCPEIAREQVPAHPWLPRTRSLQGCIFLHGDTEHGRIPWGWSLADDPLEVFSILRCSE